MDQKPWFQPGVWTLPAFLYPVGILAVVKIVLAAFAMFYVNRHLETSLVY
jgi:hypothetical protein